MECSLELGKLLMGSRLVMMFHINILKYIYINESPCIEKSREFQKYSWDFLFLLKMLGGEN